MKKKSTIFGVISLILAAALVIVAGIGSALNGKWFANSDLKSWFNYWGQGNLNEPRQFLISDENDEGELKFETKYIATSLFASRGIEKTAEAAYTLTVTEKDGGYVPALLWESGFVNPNSSWAHGKNANDYVTVTPDSDSHSATVVCKQAFGEQIKITAKLATAPEVSVSRTADYVSRIESASTPFNIYELLEVSEVSLKLNITYGTGTVKGYISNAKAYGELSDEAYNYITTSGTKAYPYYQQMLQNYGQGCSVKKQTSPLEVLEDDDLIDNPVIYNFGVSAFFGEPSNNSGFYNAYSNVFAAMADNTSNQLRAKISFTYSYGDSYSETVEAVSPWTTIDMESLLDNFPVTLAMSGADLVF